MLDITFQQLLLRGLSLVALAAVHGFLLAAAARLLGDRGPGYDGRFTLNPAAHLDWIGSASFMLFLLGWIKPMTIDPGKLRTGRAGLVLTAVLALAGTLAFALALLALRPLVYNLVGDVALVSNLMVSIRAIVEATLWFVALNILPIPPLTGGLVLAAVAPAVHARLTGWSRYIGLAIAAAAFLTIPQTALEPIHAALERLAGIG